MWLLIKIPLSLMFGDHWASEGSFWKPKGNSTEEKLVQSQYNGTRINMIHRDGTVIYDESLPMQKVLVHSSEGLI